MQRYNEIQKYILFIHHKHIKKYRDNKTLNDEILRKAYGNPIFAKDITKKGMDNALQTANKFNEHLETASAEGKRQSHSEISTQIT